MNAYVNIAEIDQQEMGRMRDPMYLKPETNFPAICRHPAVEALRAQELAKYDREYFSTHYWREDLPGLTGNHGLSYDDPDHKLRFAFIYETLVAPQTAKHLLDVGCGTGLLLLEALEHGIDAWGIDCSSVAKNIFIESAPREVWNRFDIASAASLPFDSSSFDLLVCMDVLEHLPVFDFVTAIQELCRVSSDKIVCSINVDNPYDYHPTILSRQSWVALFESVGGVIYDISKTEELNRRVKLRYPEYDIFFFRRK
jgi:2-polyprenyl-3-methyl-5-hydroxy-6-metoxy-1,4-benzoquinol methylase